LGLAVANRIVLAGGKVTLLDVNEAQGSAAAAALGNRAAFMATDVTDESAVNSGDRSRSGNNGLDQYGGELCVASPPPPVWSENKGAMAGRILSQDD